MSKALRRLFMFTLILGITVYISGPSIDLKSAIANDQSISSQDRSANMEKIDQFLSTKASSDFLSEKGVAKEDFLKAINQLSDEKISKLADSIDGSQMAQSSSQGQSSEERLKEAQAKEIESRAEFWEAAKWYLIGGLVLGVLLLLIA